MTRRLLLLLSALLLVLVPAPAGWSAPSDDEDQVTISFGIPSGSPGERVVIAADVRRGGEPAAGLTVVFTWRSWYPDAEVTESTTTDESGFARTEVVLGMQTLVTGTVLDATGAPVTSATAHHSEPVCRCTPPLAARLTGLDARNGDDRLVLRGTDHAAGATADLYRVDARGKAERIRRSSLDGRGHRAWRVTDRNARRVTRYFARVHPTDTSRRATTITVRVR
ncbi:hypothetical protein G6553_20150 [Nocardioides sp. IC4_145]|uniref:hypothetical protein n=1 Tax=Nocardioides sp. IC4_145 TaxID=2714037 RepID=UPI00140912AF|nr:hypothetical protein [Nocardioides sp. IC4_145]NHC25476.1 hypothetical protein [Nocardioides sp. IC4_145]